MAYSIVGPYLAIRPSNKYGFYASSVPAYQIDGHRTRIWRKKPKGFALLTSPTSHVAYRSEITREPNVNSWTGAVIATPTSPSLQVFPSSEANAAYATAVLNLRSKIKGETMNLAVFSAELPKTLEFFGSIAKTIVDAYRAVKRGDMRTIRKLIRKYRHHWSTDLTRELAKSSKDVGKKWLMWRYAVSPLVYDLDDALSELHRSGSEPLVKRVASGSGKKVWTGLKSPFMVSSSYSVTIGCYLMASPSSQAWSRLGLINLPATLWELTPLSFVVDWFLPVGDFLGSLDSLVGVNLLSTWASMKEENYGLKKSEVSPHFDTVLDGWYYKWQQVGTFTTGLHVYKTSHYRRVANPGLSIPPLNYIPGLNVSRFFDGLALIRGSMRR